MRTATRRRFHRHAALAIAGLVTAPCGLRLSASSSLRGAASIAVALAEVQAKVKAASEARAAASGAKVREARLVAVSKTKPLEDLQEAYQAGQRHFGENYVQELLAKVPEMPPDVEWHFVGRLQSNKASALINGCPSLACLETVSSEKLARLVNKAWLEANPSLKKRLRVMVQINSSGEESKGGLDAEESIQLCKYIATECEALELAGLMTIGAPDYSGCRVEDFELLRKTREKVAAMLEVPAEDLELSMGMSNDYETAIKEGSTSVRVGSCIFGAREYPKKG